MTIDPTSPLNRIAGAPISWGVCEVPIWGYQLTPDRVLAEMQDVGLSAAELARTGSCPRTWARWPRCSTPTT